MPRDTTNNRVRERRKAVGLSQAELAERAGISRTAVTAIEGERLVPSVAAALAIAETLGGTVEELFGNPPTIANRIEWAVPTQSPCRYWHVEVGGCRWLYPVEATHLGELPHDGVWNGKLRREEETTPAEQVLIVATCDPAVGLLAGEYARQTSFRMLPLIRSSRDALRLMQAGKIHAAGVHLSSSHLAGGNASIIRQEFGTGHRLLRVGVWQEGVAFATHLKLRTAQAAVQAGLQWVGREEGSAARECLDELLAGRLEPRHTAPDHRAVALAIQCGWADAGVCLRLAGEEAGLGFLQIRREAYDLCFPEAFESDRRIQALIQVVQSARYRRLLNALSGYESRTTGDLSDV
ncbi:MAG: substrate-binding domain-containing protein [Planctomycetota bacterium]